MKTQIAILAILAPLIACTSDEDVNSNSVDTRQDNIDRVFAKMPLDRSTYECREADAEPTFCDWLERFDALVRVEVVSVQPVFLPAWGTKVDRFVDECPYPTEPVMEIQAKVTEAYVGELLTGDLVSIRVGSFFFGQWEPQYKIESQASGGAGSWVAHDVVNSDRGIDRGTEFVAALGNTQGYYTFNSHLPLVIKGNTVRFQESTNDCLLTYHPLSTLPSTLLALETAAVKCTSIGENSLSALKQNYLPKCTARAESYGAVD